MLMMMTNLEAARQMSARFHCLMSKEAMHAFADILVSRKYRKGERILDEGDVCRGMLYIEKGMTRQFYFKYDKDLTEHIGYEGGMIMCLESLLKQGPMGTRTPKSSCFSPQLANSRKAVSPESVQRQRKT